MRHDYQFFATAPKHMEALLARELMNMGANQVLPGRAGVGFKGDLEIAYRACLFSRIGNRILFELAEFPAASPDELYENAKRVNWNDHLNTTSTFAVNLTARRSTIRHTKYASLKVKDAVVDQFRARFAARPSIRLEQPDIRIHVHIDRDIAHLSLDLSGESLHRRGYRDKGGEAPLKENLAAAVLFLAKWPEISALGGGFIDPMCGSGTFVIEAALMAADIAPGSLRKYFGFLKWNQHKLERWKILKEEAEERRQCRIGRLAPMFGYDVDKRAIKAAWTHIARAGLEGIVHIEKKNFLDCGPLQSFKGKAGLIAVNPPYGQRTGKVNDLSSLYRGLGQTLKEHFIGWKATVLIADTELGFQLGIRSKKPYSIFNGGIECKLLNLDIEPERFFEPKKFIGKDTNVQILLRNARAQSKHPRYGVEMFANRLKKNIKNLRRWVLREDVHCCRVYDADLPEFNMAVDVYQAEEKWAHVQEYSAPASIDPKLAEARLTAAIGQISEVLAVSTENIAVKIRKRQKGFGQYEKMSTLAHFFEVREAGCRFLVNLHDYLDTGIFLDHRMIRAMIRDQARAKRFLNLFAYTGTATVYAALGGAESTTTVDLSATYLNWAKNNLALNGISGGRHALIEADCRQWIEKAQKQSPTRVYDLIFLDPPTFSNSKSMNGDFDVQRDHAELIENVLKLLAPGGLLLFSTNYRKFRIDDELVKNWVVEDISRSTLSKDFARNPKIHSCWKIRSN